jgi:hypothetical protein
MKNLNQYFVDVEDFLKLTKNRNLQRYISLIDNHIRFDEIPGSPHGELINYITLLLGNQFQNTNVGKLLYGMADNGMVSAILCLLWQTSYSTVASNVRI